jgi:hypothetical protein
MSGKGSKPRPYSVPLTTFDNNYDAIFRKNKKSDEEKFDDAIMKNEYYNEDLNKLKEKDDN